VVGVICILENHHVNWNIVQSNADAEELIDTFGGFHDACIKEAHLLTKHHVNENLSMSSDGELDTSIKFIVQRQFKNPSCIEMHFEEVTRFNLVPTEKNYNSVIYEASIIIEDDEIWWLIDTD